VRRTWIVAATVALGIVAAACNTQGSDGGGDGALSGAVEIDGSSTVFPISEAIAEEFGTESGDVRVRVGQSGTGGGFEKFCAGTLDIADASRPIDDDEKAACEDENIDYLELKVAIDGLSVVVNASNDFAECLTTDELKEIWEPDSTVKTWRDINPEWPSDEIKLYGPGADSGTFDYFTEEINGEQGASRSDYQQSEDDNVLVQGVSGDTNALGYFGYAYYKPNTEKLKALGVDGGEGCIDPTDETIKDGTYVPLSRPLYIYVTTEALEREEVQAFTSFYLDNVNAVLTDVGYIEVPAEDLEASKQALDEAIA
jgi:phosphate transport system substrate-binding protein